MVDDGSIDNSYEKMKKLHSIDSRVKIIQLDGNFGQQNAINVWISLFNRRICSYIR